jgi:spermidine/putrescine transport system ATP-binding protein
VLLLDEPLGALDLKLRADMQTQLKDLQRAVGITFCYVTHDQGEAFSMSDRVAVMNAGVLEQVGPPEDVYRRPQSLFVADFVGSANRLYGEVVSASADGYRVGIDGIGERTVPGPPAIAIGARVVILIRPEDVTVAAPTATGQNGLPATVIDAAFLGAQRTIRLDRELGGSFVATTRAGRAAHAPGSKVEIQWQPEDAWALPATAPA